MAGGSLDAMLLPKDAYPHAQVAHSLAAFVVLGVGLGSVVGLLFGAWVMLPPWVSRVWPRPRKSVVTDNGGVENVAASPSDRAI